MQTGGSVTAQGGSGFAAGIGGGEGGSGSNGKLTMEGVAGAELDVPTLTRPVKYKFPEGTQPGQVFRLRGEGVTHLRGGGKGDLYVTAVVEIPKKLTSQQKELLRQFDGMATNNQYEKKNTFFDRVKSVFGK